MTTPAVKQDSNFTQLRYAVEESPGVLPTTPTWIPVEPNDYKDFGGEVKTKARRPINASRQRKKGVVVDIDAMGGFGQDVTTSNVQDLMQSILFAALRTKGELSVATVDNATNAYQPASGGDVYLPGDLVLAKSFSEDANDGLNVADVGATATSVPVTGTGLVAETGASGIISKVGIQFAAGVASIDANGGVDGFPRIAVANVVAASTFTVGGGGSVIQNGDTLTINGKVYTWQTVLTNVDGHVLIGANDTAALLNMKNAINLGTNAGTYAALTTLNAYVTAVSSNATTLVVNAKVTGVYGNTITTVESSAGAWGSNTAHLSGGVGRDLTTLGLIPGEPLYIGGDTGTAGGDQFAIAPEDNGWARIRQVGAGFIDLDKTESQMLDDAGTGQLIRLFFGRVCKNENSRALIIKRPLQFERTLGAPDDDAPETEQAEYITRSYIDEANLDGKTADILTFDIKLLGGTHETVDGTLVPLKSGIRPDIVDSDAFNTTSNISLIKMAIVGEDGDAFPDPLFAHLTDLKIGIKNNLKQNKALSVLGAFDVTAGVLEVTVDASAYFTKVASVEAVKNNESVTLEAHFAKDNKGLSFDMPLLALGKAKADVKIDEAIMLPMTGDAASGAQVDPTLDYTIMTVFWDYLPDAAM